MFLTSKALDCFLIFQDILVCVSLFFENLDYVSYKGVSYKPYCVYAAYSAYARVAVYSLQVEKVFHIVHLPEAMREDGDQGKSRLPQT